MVGQIACTVHSAGDRLYLLHISDETKLAWLPAHLTPEHLRHQFDVLAQELNVSHLLCSAGCCTGGSQQVPPSCCVLWQSYSALLCILLVKPRSFLEADAWHVMFLACGRCWAKLAV